MYKDIFPRQYFINNDTFDKYHISLFYKTYVLNDQYYKYIFDDWYSQGGYGKYDKDGNVIYPKNSFLKEYKNNTSSIQKNLLFVADSFKDLKEFYKQLETREKIAPGSIYTNLNAYSSTKNIEDMYINYINDVFSLFQSYYFDNTKNYFPNSFEFYIKKIILFFRIILKIGVINRSSYMSSILAPTSSDGLRISLCEEPEYHDFKKIANKFVGDKGFDFFIKTAARFGFFIDKYRPWSIVADLNSPVILDYALKYNLKNKNDILETCYHKAYTVDLENLINVVISMWNLLVSNSGTQTVTTQSSVCNSVDRQSYNLKQITREMFNHYFHIGWQIRFYTYTRILEEKIYYPQEKFEILVQQACSVQKLSNTEESLKFINMKISEYLKRIENKRYKLTDESEFAKLLIDQVDITTKEELHF